MICCIQFEDYIGIVATLIGACAVFITFSPIVYHCKLRKAQKEIDELKKITSGIRNQVEIAKKIMEDHPEEVKKLASQAESKNEL